MEPSNSSVSRSRQRVVHVWRALTDGHDVLAVRRLLGTEDATRAARIRDPDARARFTVARAALREILGRHIGAQPDRLAFSYTSTGKPTLVGVDNSPGFSLSHAADLVLVAIWPDGAVGIDAERIRAVARQDRIEQRLFPEPIVRRLCALPDEERRLAFFHAWTQREAYVKAIGGSLFRTDDPLPLLWPPDASLQRISVPAEAHERGATAVWTVCTLRPAAGFIASVVAEGAVSHIQRCEYPEDLDRIEVCGQDASA